MPLETITAELRRRNAWEATDLGVVMVRQWLGPIYAAWFAVALPLFVLLHLLCWENWPVVPWLMWWLKPLLDRPPLYILSQALFGDSPKRCLFWRKLPELLLHRQALAALTWRRLDSARSFSLPVSQLEALTGKARRQRLRDLGHPGRGSAVWLTVVCLHLEIAMDFALIALVWLLIPDFVALELFDLFDDHDAWGQLWLNVVGFCGLSLVEPYYVAAGFTLYLNRRAWLEAWDLELSFRKLAARLAPLGGVAALCLGLALGSGLLTVPVIGFAAAGVPLANTPPPEAEAAPINLFCVQRRERAAELAQASSSVKQALAETLKEPELQVCERQKRWRWRDARPAERPERSSRDPRQAQWFAATVEGLLWVALGIFITMAGGWLWRRAPGLPKRVRRRSGLFPVLPMPGHDAMIVPPEAGLGDTAWRLWSDGQPREALRLLYRGSLAGLATQHGLPVRKSTTEEECLRLAAAQLADSDLLGFLRRLVRAWQAAAYAHRLPDAADARRLCVEWSRHFAITGELLT
ncbi:MAG: DUF4129 domain-containing protein [Gammaproteobacteria bacterium]|nr:DUF4129 domain-containing protein [Gammaproteobacteria bacterium]